MRLEELADILFALAYAIFAVAVPGTGLVDQAMLHADIDDLALTGDAEAIQNFEP